MPTARKTTGQSARRPSAQQQARIGAICRCWCGGLFHGQGGEDARLAFVKVFTVDAVPTTERAFLEITGQLGLFGSASAGERWRSSLVAARAARQPVPITTGAAAS